MNKRRLEKEILADFVRELNANNSIRILALRSENKALKMEVARQRRDLLLAGAFMDGADEQYDKLLADVIGRKATVTPPKPGITRFHIGGLTMIARERDLR